MKKFAIEIKWGILFTIITLLWTYLEKSFGWHGELIQKHATNTNYFAIVAIAVYVIALLDKRKNYYSGKMKWVQGFSTGMFITLIIAILSPLAQYITHIFITPGFFPNVIQHTIEQGKLSQEEAEAYFNLKNYIFQSILGGVIMGVITSAIVAIFVKKK